LKAGYLEVIVYLNLTVEWNFDFFGLVLVSVPKNLNSNLKTQFIHQNQLNSGEQVRK
jgi:hypothetical protein